MDAIFHRTSIRKYQETPVEAEKIETLAPGGDGGALRLQSAVLGVLCGPQ